MARVANFVPAISAEGTETTTDARRGKGTYAKINRKRHDSYQGMDSVEIEKFERLGRDVAAEKEATFTRRHQVSK
ncbi:hypothetical protein [Enorma phocaeensis]|uniref:Uncharacterized protein n=1 Tax=Enorma phocaeensis TaxID=1871019 RepID=A0ABT7V6G9_9ACTN|nr:hypothetical protein [Enorma phocaeensis]MDM8274096.1 hypothetical protein [Enorma phocaeensis]